MKGPLPQAVRKRMFSIFFNSVLWKGLPPPAGILLQKPHIFLYNPNLHLTRGAVTIPRQEWRREKWSLSGISQTVWQRGKLGHSKTNQSVIILEQILISFIWLIKDIRHCICMITVKGNPLDPHCVPLGGIGVRCFTRVAHIVS